MFPMNVICDILILLPVKSLLRFKSVCKAWRDLINSSYFIKSHLNHDHGSSSIQHGFIVFVDQGCQSLSLVHDFDTITPTTSTINLPFKVRSLIGSSKGIVCITHTHYPYYFGLFNPSNRTFKMVPYPTTNVGPIDTNMTLGFGYDSRAHDYKIVRFSTTEVFIYSLRENTWKVRQRPLLEPVVKYLHASKGDTVIINNCLNTIQHNKIVCFNLDSENLGLVPHPDFRKEIRYWLFQVGCFEGCLCLHVLSNYPCKVESEIWVMKEYGVKESWMKLFCLPREGGIPLAYCKDRRDEIIFVRPFKNGYFRGNPEQGKTTNRVMDMAKEMFDGYGVSLCVESLICLDYKLVMPRKEVINNRKRKRGQYYYW